MPVHFTAFQIGVIIPLLEAGFETKETLTRLGTCWWKKPSRVPVAPKLKICPARAVSEDLSRGLGWESWRQQSSCSWQTINPKAKSLVCLGAEPNHHSTPWTPVTLSSEGATLPYRRITWHCTHAQRRRDRQTNRQRDRHAGRQVGRQAGRQTWNAWNTCNTWNTWNTCTAYSAYSAYIATSLNNTQSTSTTFTPNATYIPLHCTQYGDNPHYVRYRHCVYGTAPR